MTVVGSNGLITTGRASRVGEMRTAYRIFISKPEWKRPLVKPKHGREFKFKNNRNDFDVGILLSHSG
jgi:hypothetical protein